VLLVVFEGTLLEGVPKAGEQRFFLSIDCLSDFAEKERYAVEGLGKLGFCFLGCLVVVFKEVF